MHCVSCEIILSKELKKLDGFSLTEISHKKWYLIAEYKDEKQLQQAIKLIKKHNFQVQENKQDIQSHFHLEKFLIKIIFLLFIGIIFYLIHIFVDINSLIPQNQNGSFITTFIIWLIASVSTCLAVTGWIVIGFSKAFSNKISGIKWSVIIQSWFQFWRIFGFFLLWGLLWLLGEFFSISLKFSTILTLIISFVLIYIWLQVLEFVPNISKFWFHLPKSFSHKVEKLQNPKMAPIVWALTFFIPCGFTQTAQLLAIWSGDFLTGWLIMLFFALGTFPVLFLVWVGSSYFSGKKFPFIEMLLWIIILLFGINTLINASNLLPSLFTKAPVNQDVVSQDIEFETVYAKHTGWNIEWYDIKLKAWGNYKVIIMPERDGMGCMWTLTIPTISNKIHHVLQWRPIVYEIVDAQVGIHKIVCSSMWMTQWSIIIE